mmetsp:Transcript_25663/g.37786  ORF Transcript_25663/g.37786 Transcript_25663/m.37786 type:complete len:219 (+) Transcript_25663:1105-1761(+)
MVLFQSRILKPRIIISGILLQLRLILRPLLHKQHILNPLLISMLLLERHVGFIKRSPLLQLLLGQVRVVLFDIGTSALTGILLIQMKQLHGMLVNDPGTVILTMPFFKPRKHLKHPGVHLLRFQFRQCTLEHTPCHTRILSLELTPFRKLQKTLRGGIRVHVPFHHLPCPLHVTAPAFKPRVRQKRVIVGYPLHPPLEHRPRLLRIPHHLLHVHVLVP